MTGKRILTVKEAAEFLGLCPRSVYALLQRGDIPHIRHGTKTIRIKREDLEAYEQERQFRGEAQIKILEPGDLI